VDQAREEGREDQWLQDEREVGVVLGQVEACLRQLEPPGQQGQETQQWLLHLVRDRQVQLMEPWREEQKRQQREKHLRQELLELRWALQQLHQVWKQLRQELHNLRGEQVSMVRTFSPFQLVLQWAQENVDWRELDRLMDLWVTRDWPALDRKSLVTVELNRVRLRPSLDQGQPTLLDVILANNSKFKGESPHLDVLLVFVSVILYATNHGKD